MPTEPALISPGEPSLPGFTALLRILDATLGFA